MSMNQEIVGVAHARGVKQNELITLFVDGVAKFDQPFHIEAMDNNKQNKLIAARGYKYAPIYHIPIHKIAYPVHHIMSGILAKVHDGLLLYVISHSNNATFNRRNALLKQLSELTQTKHEKEIEVGNFKGWN